MTRLIAIAAVLLVALSSGLMGITDMHRNGAGTMSVPAAAETVMSGHVQGSGERRHDRAGYHMSCAIAGHSCTSYVTPETKSASAPTFARQAWSVPSDRLATGLYAEATTPPPRG